MDFAASEGIPRRKSLPAVVEWEHGIQSGFAQEGVIPLVRIRNRLTLKALANVSTGRGPHAGSPRGVEVFALKPWGSNVTGEIVRI